MYYIKKLWSKLLYWLVCIVFVGIAFFVIAFCTSFEEENTQAQTQTVESTVESSENESIEKVNFSVTYEALKSAMQIDIESNNSDHKINWIDLLAYYASVYGEDFSKFDKSIFTEAVERLSKYDSTEVAFKDIEKFSYYKEIYNAVLGEFVGYYKSRVKVEESNKITYETKYGLMVFSPIAKSFKFSDYDDFGAKRTYGYNRTHLGHDMFAQTGTPVVAVESGTVEKIGWNRYGGWRIGIKSHDKKRYYYYAHLRKDAPFQSNLSKGKEVIAGDVIGYVGKTGYSKKENVNNLKKSHLHIGMQLIFDQSEDSHNKEIWINLYNIIRLLNCNRSEVYRDNVTKEFYRKNQFIITDK